ncbi:hypothetical protein ACWT_3485 [Actinoplanes sp. SE50]|uniref:hypothetical protein n=1 Tax=unclassified Actinoplanes TaxID=2626549 RepID=UPI00023EBB9B|nr:MULTISPECIES: hypothetical protein [unclassified Actinoplanes]AEV84508.1 hypothetical protein ACPL_3613 [Actinoplanes sp. SE50/110]ATO82900.1 hypothetical protein ACWT_3485 [Actinoplanes sp. SE50]SLM00308.1 hypothetical protein ACSP50_3540 [Actinoplanes sp. SE50/110]
MSNHQHAVTPWQQAGHPPVRVQATSEVVYPFALEVGEHDGIRIPMTAMGMSALRDALDAALSQPRVTEAKDFVAEWAYAHRAVVVGD